MAENSTEYKYTVDIRSIPQKPKGIAKIVPTGLRAKYSSRHEAFGDPYLTRSQAKELVKGTVGNFESRYGKQDRRYFGIVAEEGIRRT